MCMHSSEKEAREGWRVKIRVHSSAKRERYSTLAHTSNECAIFTYTLSSVFIHVIRMEFISLWDNFKIRSKILIIDEKIRIFSFSIVRLLCLLCFLLLYFDARDLYVKKRVFPFSDCLMVPLPPPLRASHPTIDLPQFDFRFSLMMPRWHAYNALSHTHFAHSKIVSLRQSVTDIFIRISFIAAALLHFCLFSSLHPFVIVFDTLALRQLFSMVFANFCLKVPSEMQTFEGDVHEGNGKTCKLFIVIWNCPLEWSWCKVQKWWSSSSSSFGDGSRVCAKFIKLTIAHLSSNNKIKNSKKEST